MKKIELAGAFTVLGVLVVSQLMSGTHGDMDMPGQGEGDMAAPEMTATMPNMVTANLVVTGMT